MTKLDPELRDRLRALRARETSTAAAIPAREAETDPLRVIVQFRATCRT